MKFEKIYKRISNNSVKMSNVEHNTTQRLICTCHTQLKCEEVHVLLGETFKSRSDSYL